MKQPHHEMRSIHNLIQKNVSVLTVILAAIVILDIEVFIADYNCGSKVKDMFSEVVAKIILTDTFEELY